jgi:flagella basal body P-ring formation protein FlgA
MRRVIAFVAFLAAHAVVAAAEPLPIVLHANLQVDGAEWRIIDALELPTVLRSSALGQLRVPAPLPEHTDRWRPEQLERIIRARITGTLPPFEWSGADRLIVTRKVQALGGDELVAAAAQAWRQVRQGQDDMLVEPVQPIPSVNLPTGKYQLRARRIANPGQGSVVVWLDVLISGRVVHSASVALRDRGRHPVYIAKRTLDVGEPVRADDFQREDIEGGSASSVVPGMQPARLRRALRQGEVLNAEALVPADAVRSGDPLQVVLRQQGILVEVSGTAASDARPGQMVTVRWPQGREVVRGRLLDNGKVAIE